MTFTMNSRDYMQYVKLVCKKIADSKDYISEIDAAPATATTGST